ncbi:MAG: TatD family hydrolase, partial [Clostridiales bacterium]|nr:TatD family hydrolase [Clostridiales bacterium]
HYDDEQFDTDREALLSSFAEGGICGCVTCGTNTKNALSAVALSEKYPFMYAAVGLHPLDIEDEESENYIEFFRSLSSHKKVVAIGEIGLDYHYDTAPKEQQIEVLEKQIILAKELDLPVIVHDRESHEDVLNILKKHKPRGVVHCFSGSVEMMREVVKLGMYIGLGGAVTFKNAKKPVEVAKETPSDRLLIETDAPYMTPVPFRGKRNGSSLIPFTAEKIAEVRNTTAQEILDLTSENAKKLFNL